MNTRKSMAAVLLCAATAAAQAPRPARPSPQAPRVAAPAAAVGSPLPAPAMPTAADALARMTADGRPYIDIRSLGAVPGTGAAATSTRRAIQAALDAFRLPGVPPGRPTVYIPPGNWLVDRWVSPPAGTANVLITGEGASSVLMAAGNGFSPILLGMPFAPAPSKRAMDPAQFFPLDGLMDSTVKNRSGYRTCPPVPAGAAPVNGCATAWDTPLDLGPVQGWGVVPCLTIEFCIDTTATPIGRAAVAGMSKGAVAGPWLILGAPGQVRLLTTLDGEAASRVVALPYTDKGGIRRFVFQRNLAAGKDLFALDGIRVTPAGDAPPAGSKLADNLDLPFHIGASGASGVVRADYFQGNPTSDLALCGLRISTVARYDDTTPAGRPIARLDGSPVTDANSYFQSDADTLGYLNVTADPADLAACRFVPFSGPAANTFAAFAIDPSHGNNASSLGPVGLSGVSLRTVGAGPALTIGAAIDTTIAGCTLDGVRGIGSPSGLVNYTTRIRDGVLYGTVGAVRLYGATALFDSCRFGRVGRDGVLAARGSVAKLRDCWNGAQYAPGCTPRTYYRAVGGALLIDNCSTDNEEGASPTLATLHVTATSGDVTNQPAYLRIDRCGSNTHKGIPLVLLDRESPNAPLATARITDPQMTAGDAVVATYGGWSVRLDDPADRKGMPAVQDWSSPGPPAPGQQVGTVTVAGAK
jgi:hypothetical protein